MSLEIDRIYQGDCREVMAALEENYIHAIICDPPYELAFMGKKWDALGIAYDPKVWSECYRVLRPGGHLLSFGGTRTYHRMVVTIEDTGFEIRDTISWVYGSGFPKSLDISKALDKMAGAEREIISMERIAPDGKVKRNVACVDKQYGTMSGKITKKSPITAPSTDAAKQWAGYGSALKPAHEMICVARKPLSEKTIAENILKWETGAINVDACRIGMGDKIQVRGSAGMGYQGSKDQYQLGEGRIYDNQGRFPANFIHDGSPDVLAEFAKAGERSPGAFPKGKIKRSGVGNVPFGSDSFNENRTTLDSGSAARFFQACPFTEEDIPAFVYYAKAARAERERGLQGMPEQFRSTMQGDRSAITEQNGDALRNGSICKNQHPTVKPLSLMRYLCKLVCPPGGLILDPFAGSGTTCLAARLEGFSYIGIEIEAEYVQIAKKRLAAIPVSLDAFCEDEIKEEVRA